MSKLAKFILILFGWTLVGECPSVKKYVVIIGPHTSNWDFFIFILVKMAYRVKIVFIGKHTIFVFPFKGLLKKLGGLPVNRSSAHDVVQTIVDEFKMRKEMVFALSPEGTRSYLDHWKSGFYHIAMKANVPVQTAFLNVTDKTVGWGPMFNLTGSIENDLKKLSDFYADKKGFKPEKFSKIVFNTTKQ